MKNEKKLDLLYVDAGAHPLSRPAMVLHEKVKTDMLKGVKENKSEKLYHTTQASKNCQLFQGQ